MFERFISEYTIQGILRSLIIFGIVMLPNIIFFSLSETNSVGIQPKAGTIFNVLESAMRFAFFACLFLETARKKEHNPKVLFYIAIVAMILYYTCWIIFFYHKMEAYYMYCPFFGVPVPLAVFPVTFFIMMALYTKSYAMGACSFLFGIGHIVNSLSIYAQILENQK